MKTLRRKLWRDLWRMRAQVLSISLVLACGVAGFVGQFSTHASLETSRDRYYSEANFADVFAVLRRAPVALGQEIAAIPGVAQFRLDVSFDVQLALEGVREPLIGRFIGLPEDPAAGLNRLRLRAGRWPMPAVQMEAVVSERFAQLRRLMPGSRVQAVLDGRLQEVLIVGTVLSPEYVFATRGGAPDDQSFGVFWVERRRLAAAFDMQGAFNRVAVALARPELEAAVIDALDRLLSPWGGSPPVRRIRQASAAIVDNELRQLEVLGTVLPSILLGVAVFVLHAVMARLVATQRQQIATLKALGYTTASIAWHYTQFALVITLIGLVWGWGMSQWLGSALLGLYAEVFRFDALDYRLMPAVLLAAAGSAAIASCAGALAAMRPVLRLPAAQAMMPPVPPRFERSLVERLIFARHPVRWTMVARNLTLRPWRLIFTTAGIAAAVALQISGACWYDTLAHIVDVQYRQAQRADALLEFARPVPLAAAADLMRMPGVIQAELVRVEPIRIHREGRVLDSTLTGMGTNAQLLRVIDTNRGAVSVPEHGLMVNALLARELGLSVGDHVTVSFQLRHRQAFTWPVVEVVETMFGRQVYLDLSSLNRLAGDGEGANMAALLLDMSRLDEFYRALKRTRWITAATDRGGALRSFEESTARNLGFFVAVLTVFSVAMAGGTTYNAARIALSEREWELASLRVMGMSRSEVSQLLLAELGLMVAAALPLGCLAGWQLAHALMRAMRSENIDFPAVIAASTYVQAVAWVIVAAIASAFLVRLRIRRLDLVIALKIRE